MLPTDCCCFSLYPTSHCPIPCAAPAAAATAADDDEVDPLDAFMAAEVLPEVAKLAAEEAERRAASEAREVSPAPGEGGPGAMDVDVDVKPEVG